MKAVVEMLIYTLKKKIRCANKEFDLEFPEVV